ncbi:MAG: tRNA glutamyl-Q(34) synthetase GluQRS [Rhizobiales bacterium]|nr:tRNA glutamyl-Q(34) synthetase GluQRS [Hyphomicrobiales bacterium]OJY45136.1 MAG: tRNA glutamyl-Q(34) synthetase GluQRS [Rhizobiales bacterium 64-17]
MSVFRFAPSPNGYLHLGHAYSALLNAQAAEAVGGRLLLRIEDIDPARCRPEFERAIYDDLDWLGLRFAPPIRRQSEHLAEHRAALERLQQMGLIYPSFESRADIARLVTEREEEGESWPRDPDGAPLYPGTDKMLSPPARQRRIEEGRPYALRLDMSAALARVPQLTWREAGREALADPAAWGDVVLARKDAPVGYHLAVTMDDAAQGVTHVVRGLDLYHATSIHRLLQALLGLPEPAYHHHRLILDEAGDKLSKSTQATGLRELRAAGKTRAGIYAMIGL